MTAVRVYEVGPRDGLQNEPETVPTPAKLELIGRLAVAGLSQIEVTSFVSPRWIPQLADADALVPLLPALPGVEYGALVPNAEGYARTAPLGRAKELHGQLLLVHGTADDNVHAENTMRMADALQQAGKPFRLMLYPGQRHTFTDPLATRHLRALMLEFVEDTLLDSARRP